MIHKTLRASLVIGIVLALGACGGGSGEAASPSTVTTVTTLPTEVATTTTTPAPTTTAPSALDEARAASAALDYSEGVGVNLGRIRDDYAAAFATAKQHARKAAQIDPRWTELAANIDAWEQAVTVARASSGAVLRPTRTTEINTDCGIRERLGAGRPQSVRPFFQTDWFGESYHRRSAA